MSFRLLDLPDALRDQELEPVLVDGWTTRGLAFDALPIVHLRHWTAGPRTGKAPSLGTVTNGRGQPSPLPGPLAQVLQERTGGPGFDRVYVIASGRANHAGEGKWAGITSGNRQGTGNEIEWSGPAEAFPANRVETSIRIAAALQSLGANPNGSLCCEHREYALPAGRKIDTNLSGDAFRLAVQIRLKGGGDEDMDAEQDKRLKIVEAGIIRLTQYLTPRTAQNVMTEGPDMGKVVPVGTPNSEQAGDLWRWAVFMEFERKGASKVFAGHIATAVVAALPPSSGGGATVAQIEAAVAKVLNAELGFLKPGQ